MQLIIYAKHEFKSLKARNSRAAYTCIAFLRLVHTRELAPETRSRVSTPTSTHEGHDEGAE